MLIPFNLSAAGNGLTFTDKTFGTTTVNGGAGADTVTVLNPGFGPAPAQYWTATAETTG